MAEPELAWKLDELWKGGGVDWGCKISYRLFIKPKASSCWGWVGVHQQYLVPHCFTAESAVVPHESASRAIHGLSMEHQEAELSCDSGFNSDWSSSDWSSCYI